MNKEKFEALEVKAKDKGWYLVTLFQFKKEKSEHPDHVKEWVEFDGENWDYRELKDSYYVCFIHEKETNK